jgi:TolB protein
VLLASTWGRVAGRVASPGVAPSAGPDLGGKIAYIRGGAVWLYTNGEQRQLTQGPKDENDKHDAFPALSPDGEQLVYTRIDEGFSDLYKLNLSNPDSPIALTDYRPNVEVGQVQIPGVQDGYNDLALWANYAAWTPDGTEIAFTSDVDTYYPNLRIMSSDGEDARRLAGRLDFSTQTVEHPSWAPDGTRIAVATYITAGAIGQIWVYNIDEGRWTEITDSKEGAYDPSWSPDGAWIAFAMREGGQHNIYVVPTDASEWDGDHPTPIKLTDDGGSRSPVWSPDGGSLAYLALNGTQFDLHAGTFTVDATDGTPSLQSPERVTDNANIDANSALSWSR